MTEPVSVYVSREAAYVDPSLTATLHKVSWGAIFAGGVVTLSFSGRKGQGLVDIQAKQAAIFHASKASRRW